MKKINAALLGAGLALYATSPAWALSIADVPLFQSTTVAPNVVMLLDDSGSMRHAIWADAFDNARDYVGNGVGGGVEYFNGGYQSVLDAGTYINKESMRRDDCPAGYDKIRIDGNVSKCLKFPDANGEETWFTPNYLAFLARTYVSGTDLTAVAAVPNEYRMQVLKSAAKSVVAANPSMRFGIFSFNGRIGGELNAAVGSSKAVLDATIDGLTPNSSTPLAEAYYEVTRYMRGLGYTSPQQYRCQKNFGVVITDGLPTYDSDFPADDPSDELNASASLPDWDGLAPATNGLNPAPRYSDGYRPMGSSQDDEGYTLYLDDVAKFAYDIDFKTSGVDVALGSFQDPAFLKQNMKTYTVGFSVDNQMLEDAAEYGRGMYFSANNAAELNSALSGALQSIRDQTSSAAAIATNSTRLDTDTLIYQARFNSGDWSGELIAYRLNSDGSVGLPSWRTSSTSLIPSAASRNVLSHNGTSGVDFLWDSLSAAQKTDLAAPTAADGSVIVNWLRGGSSGATLSNGEVLRSRSVVLGDIVNSDPVFVGAQNFGYTVPNDPLVSGEPADSYQSYLDSKASSSFTKTVMVGANDGMVHGFNAETGSEMFAYVPSSLYKNRLSSPGTTPGLRWLTKSNYSHKYYVDGSIGFGDVYIGSSWKTYAVGGLGAGGRGVYALDITSANSVDAADVLWEITAPDTNTAANDWNDLGYTYGLPVIARTQGDQWVAIFANGYDSNTGKAVLYVVNAATGGLIKKIVADSSDAADDTGNGLSAPAVMVDRNRRVTYVYAGDLKGNLWKFDLNASSPTSWGVAKQTSGNPRYGVPLFVAKAVDGSRQPITSGLEIGSHPNQGGLMIYFGTGKYFETSDNTVGASPQKQTFYGIWDTHVSGNVPNNWEIDSARNTALQEQSITFESDTYRAFSKTPVIWAGSGSKRGWYMDLAPPSGTAQGERAVSLPLLRAGRIIFTTIIPSADPCLAGGTSWLMELDAFTGGNLNYAVLDTNGDGEFNAADRVSCAGGSLCDPGGLKSREGIIKTPGIVSAGDTEYKYSGGSSGNILVVTEKGAAKEGRMSWRQLR